MFDVNDYSLQYVRYEFINEQYTETSLQNQFKKAVYACTPLIRRFQKKYWHNFNSLRFSLIIIISWKASPIDFFIGRPLPWLTESLEKSTSICGESLKTEPTEQKMV